MLSIANVGNGKAAANYYESSDDYYANGQSPSEWWGRGAKLLGLKGEVESELFAELLDGKLPNGDSLHNAANGRRGGTDLTFSAPKSVSIQALVGKDFKILEAHHKAVTNALAYAEQFASCRVTETGITRNELTKNLLVARFEHDLSRACDPQIHTHCVAINATMREDGQWRAMDNEFMYRMKMLLGVMYRAELARELQVLGYNIRVTHADGRFELGHINDHQVKAFSQRSKSIEDWLQKNKGLSRDDAPAWDKKLIAVITRERKTQTDREYLNDEWQKTCNEQQINLNPKLAYTKLALKDDLNDVFLSAIFHLEERESVFNHHQLLQAVLERSVGKATLAEIETKIEQFLDSGSLIKSGDLYTTLEAQQVERNILSSEQGSRGKFNPIFAGSSANIKENLHHLNVGQQDAVSAILKTQNQFLGIQGRAGSGKTTLLKSAADMAVAAGYTIKGIAPSAAAARELGAAGFQSDTIASFMNAKNSGLNSKTILFVDEAGMVSTRGMQAIVSAAMQAGSRVVLIGDTQQLKAVEAGKPFAQLQNNGMHVIEVNKIQRQKNLTLKHAVELAVDGKISLAVDVLDKQITQIRDAKTRFEQIAKDYVSLSLADRNETKVVSGTRYARAQINSAIRQKLGLTGQGIEVTFLDRKDMTRAQRTSTLSYQVDDILLAEKNYVSLGLQRGDFAKVIDQQNGNIVLEKADGSQVNWRPALSPDFSAFTAEKRELAIGDQIRFTANSHEQGVINGDQAIVIDVDEYKQQIQVKLADGKFLMLNAFTPLAIDYGYCSTVHAAQGQTCDRVLIDADTHSLTSSESTFYVAISRARHEAKIYTDDREMLPYAMSREHEKKSALDIKSLDQNRPEMEIS